MDEIVVYSKERGVYDYKAMAEQMKPDRKLVEQHSSVRVDWRGVVEALGPSDDLLAKFYRAGKPYVTLTRELTK